MTGYNLISSIYGNVIYVPRSLYAKREEMLLRHANVIAGPNGSVVWLNDIIDSFTDLPSGTNCMQTNANRSTEDGTRKVVIVKEGAGDAVALFGENRHLSLHYRVFTSLISWFNITPVHLHVLKGASKFILCVAFYMFFSSFLDCAQSISGNVHIFLVVA